MNVLENINRPDLTEVLIPRLSSVNVLHKLNIPHYTISIDRLTDFMGLRSVVAAISIADLSANKTIQIIVLTCFNCNQNKLITHISVMLGMEIVLPTTAISKEKTDSAIVIFWLSFS